MKVVFLKDVPNVARAGEVKEVSDGYGRNYLLPRKLALLSKPGMVERVEAELKAKVELEKLSELAKQLEGKELTLKAKVGAKKERLHGSITAAHIAAELEAAGIIVDKRKIDLAEPIHHLGIYEIAVKLGKDLNPKIKVTVEEKEPEPEKEPEKPEKPEKAE